MTPSDVQRLAEPLLRSLFNGSLEEVSVREDEDWSGAPSLYIDVFLVPGAKVPDHARYRDLKRTVSDTLVASGDLRFPYFRLRDRAEESEGEAEDAA